MPRIGNIARRAAASGLMLASFAFGQLPESATAAEIESRLFAVGQERKLVIQLTGPIGKGDATKLAGILENIDFEAFADWADIVVALDSPGGSYVEALAIGDLLKKHFVGTYVGEGARCESACALVFMAGTDANANATWPHRVLHPLGRLGFHAPSLTVPTTGEVPAGQVSAAYDIALASIAGLVDRMEGMEFPRSLLSAMLETPANSMYLVSTIDDANQWGIQISTDWPPLALDPSSLRDICDFYPEWKAGRSVRAFLSEGAGRWRNDLGLLEPVSRRFPRARSPVDVYRIIDNPMDGIYCYVQARTSHSGEQEIGIMFSTASTDDAFSSFAAQDYIEEYVPRSHALAPDTPIASLAPAAIHRLAPPAPESASAAPAATSAAGRCRVYSGGRLTDDEPCTLDRASPGVERYLWPSGTVTVVDRREAGAVRINGKRAFAASVPNEAGCIGNSASGNVFCHAAR